MDVKWTCFMRQHLPEIFARRFVFVLIDKWKCFLRQHLPSMFLRRLLELDFIDRSHRSLPSIKKHLRQIIFPQTYRQSQRTHIKQIQWYQKFKLIPLYFCKFCLNSLQMKRKIISAEHALWKERMKKKTRTHAFNSTKVKKTVKE